MAFLREVVSDLTLLYEECSSRRLVDAAKWASEMLYHVLEGVDEEEEEIAATSSSTARSSSSGTATKGKLLEARLKLAKSCLDCQEFDRAAELLAERGKFADGKAGFLHYYARYLAGEKRKLDNLADCTDKRMLIENEEIGRLKKELSLVLEDDWKNDAFFHYLQGIVTLACGLKEEASQCFVSSVTLCPQLWPAWTELAKITDSKDKLSTLKLPDHWIRRLFLAEASVRLQCPTEAIDAYSQLIKSGFERCPYILTRMAVAKHSLQQHDGALELFKKVHEKDRFRIEHMDLYSSTLFVKGMRVELATLAHHFFDVCKFLPETCCIVGNYYSLRGDHERAVLYFQRSLKLNPNSADCWTLIGHEFMELKNTAAACLAYRRALEVDSKDFRAWYGLGQMYDILRMPSHALYYYNMAHRCRPQDSRMIIALGDMYQRVYRLDEAHKCYWKAHCVGDIEGLALLKLGKLFEKQHDDEQAASCFGRFLAQLEQQNVADEENQPYCYRFLTDYCMKKSRLDEAHRYAQLCLEYETTKEDGKAFLKRISQERKSSPNAAAADDLQSGKFEPAAEQRSLFRLLETDQPLDSSNTNMQVEQDDD